MSGDVKTGAMPERRMGGPQPESTTPSVGAAETGIRKDAAIGPIRRAAPTTHTTIQLNRPISFPSSIPLRVRPAVAYQVGARSGFRRDPWKTPYGIGPMNRAGPIRYGLIPRCALQEDPEPRYVTGDPFENSHVSSSSTRPAASAHRSRRKNAWVSAPLSAITSPPWYAVPVSQSLTTRRTRYRGFCCTAMNSAIFAAAHESLNVPWNTARRRCAMMAILFATSFRKLRLWLTTSSMPG